MSSMAASRLMSWVVSGRDGVGIGAGEGVEDPEAKEGTAEAAEFGG